MIIAGFGLYWNTCYRFPTSMMEDNWSISRPPVATRVAGKDGSFDFYGDTNFPIEPFTVRKTVLLHSSGDYAGVETLVDALKQATIDIDESKLWILQRDDTTLWAWAKCIALNVAESGQNYAMVRATVEFFCREGIWH